MKWSEQNFLWQPGNILHHFDNLLLLIIFLRQALCFPLDQSLDLSYKQPLNLCIAHTHFLLCHKVPRHSAPFAQQDDFSFCCSDHTTPLHSHYHRSHISWLSLFRCLRMKSFRHDRHIPIEPLWVNCIHIHPAVFRLLSRLPSVWHRKQTHLSKLPFLPGDLIP